MLYPKVHYTDPARTRSLMLVNKRIVTDTWSQIDLGSSDITVVQLQTEIGKVLIINMFNEGSQQLAIKWAITVMRQRTWAGHNGHNRLHIGHTIWLGDFNLHHPMWDEGRNTHLFMRGNLEKAQVLIDALAQLDLQMALPKDIPTLQALATSNHTRPDNTFISSLIAG